MDAALDRHGHPVPLLEFDQGLIRERGELIVPQAFDLGFEFIPGDIVIETGLYEHIHVLDIVVAAGDQFEQKDILIADQPDRQSVRVEERLSVLLHPIGEDELVHDLLIENVEPTPIVVLDAARRPSAW
nr:hypothetical protein [Halobiforma lacisalsi]